MTADPEEADRFQRTGILVGQDGLERLRNAHVAIFGLGGVGGYALEAIARTGIGNILIADFDTVEPSNINRQLLALDATVGRLKTEVAHERIRQINPTARVVVWSQFIEAEKVEDLLHHFEHECAFPVQFAIDAIDAVASKASLLYALHNRGAVTVSCMGAGSRLNPTGYQVADIAATRHCPLARAVRQRLRRLGIDSGIRCVYSEENLNRVAVSDETGATDRGDGDRRKKNAQGTISYVPGLVGLMAAGVIIEDIVRGER